MFSVTSRRFFDQSAIVTFGQTLIARLMTRNLIFYLFGNQCVSTASFLNSETCLLTKMLPHHTFKMKPNLWIQPHFYHAAIERFLKQFRSKIVSVTEWLIGNTCNFLARLLISMIHFPQWSFDQKASKLSHSVMVSSCLTKMFPLFHLVSIPNLQNLNSNCYYTIGQTFERDRVWTEYKQAPSVNLSLVWIILTPLLKLRSILHLTASSSRFHSTDKNAAKNEVHLPMTRHEMILR